MIKPKDYKHICQTQKTTKDYKRLLHQQTTSKDNYKRLHQRLGHGRPITTSLDFGRGGFDLLVLGGGLGLDE